MAHLNCGDEHDSAKENYVPPSSRQIAYPALPPIPSDKQHDTNDSAIDLPLNWKQWSTPTRQSNGTIEAYPSRPRTAASKVTQLITSPARTSRAVMIQGAFTGPPVQGMPTRRLDSSAPKFVPQSGRSIRAAAAAAAAQERDDSTDSWTDDSIFFPSSIRRRKSRGFLRPSPGFVFRRDEEVVRSPTVERKMGRFRRGGKMAFGKEAKIETNSESLRLPQLGGADYVQEEVEDRLPSDADDEAESSGTDG